MGNILNEKVNNGSSSDSSSTFTNNNDDDDDDEDDDNSNNEWSNDLQCRKLAMLIFMRRVRFVYCHMYHATTMPFN